jgi:hypothetical protein
MTPGKALLAALLIQAATPLAARPLLGQAAERAGSFPVTALASTVGAVAGIAIAAHFSQSGSTMCPTVPGATCNAGGSAVLWVAGASVIGAASGAVVARQLMGGRQSFLRSLLGAGLGTMVGGLIVSQLGTTETVPVVVSFSLPQGLFAALVGS